MKLKITKLNQEAENPELWNTPEKAQKILQERTHLQDCLDQYHTIENALDEAVTLIELGESESDEVTTNEGENLLSEIQEKAKILEIESLFSGEADNNNCFIEINSGAGGTESQDWAAMLTRMYTRWAENHQFKTEVINELPGEEAGIRSITIKINGHNAYGWSKTESGVHRLVRISPFDSNARRHTSFASVWVYPEIDDSIEIEVEEKDLRVDTYRASGAGGQHVNTTDSAVRITHIPTNIVVQCQNDRSQHRNKATAIKMLKARLYELELQKKEQAALEESNQKTDNSWGHQIRSYVLQPYQMVKDLRTNYETSNTTAILNGDLDKMISITLAHNKAGKHDNHT